MHPQPFKLSFEFDTKKYHQIVDHSVSKETFDLWYDETFDLLKTHPFPEIEKLPSYYESDNYISHTDGKRNWFEKLYQVIKHKTLSGKIKIITNAFPDHTKLRVLDIGCGTGDFLFQCKKKMNCEVRGVEPNEQARALSQKKGIATIDKLEDIGNEMFDVVTMWHVLEHIPNLEELILQLKKILKPDGFLIIAVPNFKSKDAQLYGSYWAAFDVPRHLWHFSKTSIKKIFTVFQFSLIHIKPMYFDAFYVSLLSEKYKTGKMNLIRAFVNGCRSNGYGLLKKEYSSHIYILKNQNKAI